MPSAELTEWLLLWEIEAEEQQAARGGGSGKTMGRAVKASRRRR